VTGHLKKWCLARQRSPIGRYKGRISGTSPPFRPDTTTATSQQNKIRFKTYVHQQKRVSIFGKENFKGENVDYRLTTIVPARTHLLVVEGIPREET
jgi:hypothetical protein